MERRRVESLLRSEGIPCRPLGRPMVMPDGVVHLVSLYYGVYMIKLFFDIQIQPGFRIIVDDVAGIGDIVCLHSTNKRNRVIKRNDSFKTCQYVSKPVFIRT
jgi:hypothetical protein